jgi:hypothetical protein
VFNQVLSPYDRKLSVSFVRFRAPLHGSRYKCSCCAAAKTNHKRIDRMKQATISALMAALAA